MGWIWFQLEGDLKPGAKYYCIPEIEHKQLQADIKSKQKTIDSLVKEKYTKYGDGYGFLATDAAGNQVWVNSISIALEQKDEEIERLQADMLKMNDKCVEMRQGLEEESKQLKALLRYFFELPSNGIGDYDTHIKKLAEAEQVLKEK